MKIITAWIYDPSRGSIFGKEKNAKAALFTISCEEPNGCDVFEKANSCVLCGMRGGCPYGKKSRQTGYTERARGFSSWILGKQKEYAEHIGKLKSFKAFNRAYRIKDHWYLPYSHMDWDGGPIEWNWLPAEKMTAEFLARVCERRPRDWFGGEIARYQSEVVPKFISDLSQHYPDVFEMLPDEQKARLESINYVGRMADLKSLRPGKYQMGARLWEWTGEHVVGTHMHLAPCEGHCEIRITPAESQPVEITDNAQVDSDTVFLD